jgi:hypothetical protein
VYARKIPLKKLLRERRSRGNEPSERTPRKTPPHCYGPLPGYGPNRRTQYLIVGRCLVTDPDPKEYANAA